MPKVRVTLGVEEDFWKHENALWILSISLLFVKFQTIFLRNLGSGYCGLLVGNDRSILHFYLPAEKIGKFAVLGKNEKGALQ